MSEVTVVVGGKLIDATGAEPLEDSVVVIVDNRIKAVGKRGEVEIPENAKVIDASGKTVLPGLVEAHSHPLGERGPEGGFKKYYDNLVSSPVIPLLKGVENLRKLLRFGITTVRILHGAIPSAPEMRGEYLVALRTAVERGYFPAPRIIAAGCVFQTAGHIYAMVHPALVKPGWRGADGVWEVRRQTRECLAENVDVIKLLGPTGGGGLGHDAPKVQGCTLEEVEVAVEEATWKGVMVSAHAHGGPGLKNAVLAGVNTIEHGTYLHEQPEVIDMMVEKGTYLVPTMGGRFHPEYGNVKLAEESFYDEERGRMYMEAAEAVKKSFKLARKAGVKIAAGTDFMQYDISPLAWELYVYVKEGGMTNMEAIISGTKTAAEACGLKDVGTIEPGKKADIIVVDGDPLEDISLLQDREKIEVVITEGKVQVEGGRLNW